MSGIRRMTPFPRTMKNSRKNPRIMIKGWRPFAWMLLMTIIRLSVSTNSSWSWPPIWTDLQSGRIWSPNSLSISKGSRGISKFSRSDLQSLSQFEKFLVEVLCITLALAHNLSISDRHIYDNSSNMTASSPPKKLKPNVWGRSPRSRRQVEVPTWDRAGLI